MDFLHRRGGSWKKIEVLAWNANALTRAKTNVPTLARIWRGIKTDCLTSPCGEESRFATPFPVWRGPGPTRALNRQKRKCPHQTERGWLVGAEGHRVEQKDLHSRVIYHRRSFCHLQNDVAQAGGRARRARREKALMPSSVSRV